MPALSAEQQAALQETATTGQPALQWPALKHVVVLRLREVVGEYYERCTDCDNPARQTEFGEWRDRLLALLASFQRPPFTLQRLCELLLNPQRVYTSTRKLMSALEKLLMVTKTIPATPQPSAPRGAAAEAPSAGSGAAGDESGASTSMLSHRNEAEGETTPMEVDHGQ